MNTSTPTYSTPEVHYADVRFEGNVQMLASSLSTQTDKEGLCLNLNNLEKFVVEWYTDSQLTAMATADKIAGRVIYNSTKNALGYWNGTTWVYNDIATTKDLIGGILTDTNSIDFTYNTTTKLITADVKLAALSGLEIISGGLQLTDIGTAGTYTKLTTDAKGRVTSGTTLSNSDLPASGVTAGTYTKVTVNDRGVVTTGTNISAGDLPSHQHTYSQISDFSTGVQLNRLDQMAVPITSVSMNSQKITSLAEPTASSDAATKNYVDNAIQGTKPHTSVKVATTANITLSGTQTIDGVALSAGDAVLVKNQTNAYENGVYVVASGAWSRRTEEDTWAEHVSAFIFVDNGTTNGSTGWICTVSAGGTLGVTAITWNKFSSAGQVEAGDGLAKTGNVLSVNVSSGIEIANDNVQINKTYRHRSYVYTITGDASTTTFNIYPLSAMNEMMALGGARHIEVYERSGSTSTTYVWTRCYPLIQMRQGGSAASTGYRITFNKAPLATQVFEVIITRDYNRAEF